MFQPYLYYKASVSGISLFSLPISWLTEKSAVLHKDSKATVYNFSSLKGNICTCESKKDMQNITVARIIWKKSNETEAQDALSICVEWHQLCFTFNASDIYFIKNDNQIVK